MLFLLMQPTYVFPLPLGPGNSVGVQPQSASAMRSASGTCQNCWTARVFQLKVTMAAVIGWIGGFFSTDPVVTITVRALASMVGTDQIPPPTVPSGTMGALAAIVPSALLRAYSIPCVSGLSQ